jgi:DNA-binding IclR family transcriptional regulator
VPTTLDDYTITAVERACDIIDLMLADDFRQRFPYGASLTNIADETGIPPSTTFRYVVTLSRRGYLELQPGPALRYRAGSTLRRKVVQVFKRRTEPPPPPV